MEVLNLHLTVDESRVAECAVALRARLSPGQWKVLAQLAAEIVAAWESKATGSLVLVVSPDQATRELARALKAPGLERLPDHLAAAAARSCR